MQEDQKKLSSLTALFVDDESSVRDAMRYTLNTLFKATHLACNGAEALELFRNKSIDVIITDLEMPCIDGMELITQVRAVAPYKPIIVLSAHTDKEYLLGCCNLHIQAYIVKPITREKLYRALERVLPYMEAGDVEELHRLGEGVCYNEALSCIEYENKPSYTLKKKEKLLLELLLQHRNKVVSYTAIENAVWPEHWEVMSSLALRTVVKNLRKALGKEHIQNFSGQGYKLVY